jgi:ABC-type Fe3+-hydroxamate transport system substrate-binding protein
LRTAIARIADLIGTPQVAPPLVAKLDAARDKLERCLTPGRKPSWLVVYGVDGAHVYSTGGGDHIADLLAATSAPNALEGHARSARVGLEAVLAARPDVILHVAPTADLPDSAAARRWWATWEAIPAVRRGAVFVWPDDRLARNGPHLAELVDMLCDMLRLGAAE